MPELLPESSARLFFDRLLESLPDFVYFKDREGRILCNNRAHAEHLGLSSPEEAVGKTDFDFFAPKLARQKFADEQEIMRTGIGFVGKEEETGERSGRKGWVMTSKLPLYGEDGEIIGTFGTSRDISEVKQARESLEAQHRLLSTLIEILPCRIFVKDRRGRLTLTNQTYRRALGAGSAADVQGRMLSELVTDERTSAYAADDAAVLEQGREILNREDFDASPLGDKRWMLLSKVPLRDAEDSIQGIVGMAADITEQKKAEARAIAAQRELEKKNREIEAELALARELQTQLMASSLVTVQNDVDRSAPFVPRMAYLYRACALLAGDFFDLNILSPRRFSVLLCDVMGHGVKAALVTTLIRGLISDIEEDKLGARDVLARLNDKLCPLLDRPPLPRFVTALYTIVDTDRGFIESASAGHPWPMWESKGRIRGQPGGAGPDACGPALGLIPHATYEAVQQPLQHGDRLLFFTDGWTEERNEQGEEYGEKRLAEALLASTTANPTEIISDLEADMQRFSKNDVSSDDLCAVLLAF